MQPACQTWQLKLDRSGAGKVWAVTGNFIFDVLVSWKHEAEVGPFSQLQGHCTAEHAHSTCTAPNGSPLLY